RRPRRSPTPSSQAGRKRQRSRNRTICSSACRPIAALLRRGGLYPLSLYIFQAGGFALESAQVIELGAPDARGTNDFHLVDDLGIHGEDAFYSLAKTHLAHGEAGLWTSCPGDHDPLE